ncbi:hypothetical protein P4H66_30505 [Paenibacillus dokdonensis]|uniref:Abortive infection protein-like C-terminal domain-containing protein n=1 Tax=Paenibacillus dokdonensis TaxID=2567944 RepID=A0ABU6GXY6_9BACL|nr:hypothetical protein [Paenibacillus dokdonensis]MEC0244148.1 hypothetical protein [Paenibacillus dokdonensis]
MFTINLFESSMHSNHLNNNTFIKFDFDLRISESIKLFDIQMSDQTHRLQNILDIQVSAKVNSTFLKKAVGEIQPNLWVFNQGSGYREWDWILDSNDISAIEGVRSGDLYFTIDVKAIVEVRENGNKIIPITGSQQIKISESDWIRFIHYYGYSTKYGVSLPTALLNDKSWIQAYEQLDDAREHMQRGKTYDALRQCLSVIESYTDVGNGRGGPYSPKVWEEILSDITEQKRDGIIGLLTGVSTYLNKVGHHRNSKIKDNGNLPAVPVDQYEAELMVGVSHLVVTYLERLSGGNTNEN